MSYRRLVAFDEAVQVAAVPGGVGAMTIACLLSNTLDASRRRILMDAS